MSVKAPTEKNFRRAAAAPRRRRAARWLRLRTLALALAGGLAIVAGARGAELVLTAPLLQVRRVVVHGNAQLSSGEVQALVDGLRGTNILTADLAAYRRRVLESPWVAGVALRRVLPSTVEIFVSERRPVGLCRLGGQVYLVDHRGTVIDEFGPQYAEFDLPIIDGLVPPPRDGKPAVDEARAELASRLLEALAPRPDLAGRISQIDVADVRNAVVLLEDDSALLHLGEERFLERLEAYLDLAPALRERVPEIDYVDLRFGERVYVRPAAAGRGRGATRPAAVGRKF